MRAHRDERRDQQQIWSAPARPRDRLGAGPGGDRQQGIEQHLRHHQPGVGEAPASPASAPRPRTPRAGETSVRPHRYTGTAASDITNACNPCSTSYPVPSPNAASGKPGEQRSQQGVDTASARPGSTATRAARGRGPSSPYTISSGAIHGTGTFNAAQARSPVESRTSAASAHHSRPRLTPAVRARRGAGRPRRRCCSGRSRREPRRRRPRGRAASSPRARSSCPTRRRSRARRAATAASAAEIPSTENANVGTRPSIARRPWSLIDGGSPARNRSPSARSQPTIVLPADRVDVLDRGDEPGEQLVGERARLEALAERLGRRRAHLVRPPRLHQLAAPVGDAEVRAEVLVRRADQDVDAELRRRRSGRAARSGRRPPRRARPPRGRGRRSGGRR